MLSTSLASLLSKYEIINTISNMTNEITHIPIRTPDGIIEKSFIDKVTWLVHTWRPVHKFPGYLINENSEIYSIRMKCICNPVTKKHRPMIRLSKDGKKVYRFISRLSCRAFHGKPPRNHTQCNHIDLDTFNSHISNLEWVTPARNSHHRVENWGWISRRSKPLI